MAQKKILGWVRYGLLGLFALAMLGGTAGHILSPSFYEPFVPPFIPANLANITAAIVEGAIGVMLLVPRTRALGAAAFCALMIAFMPIHIWDATRDPPAIGSTAAAMVRLVIQVGLIASSFWLARSLRRQQVSKDDSA